MVTGHTHTVVCVMSHTNDREYQPETHSPHTEQKKKTNRGSIPFTVVLHVVQYTTVRADHKKNVTQSVLHVVYVRFSPVRLALNLGKELVGLHDPSREQHVDIQPETSAGASILRMYALLPFKLRPSVRELRWSSTSACSLCSTTSSRTM